MPQGPPSAALYAHYGANGRALIIAAGQAALSRRERRGAHGSAPRFCPADPALARLRFRDGFAG